jgi:hypothetical protein
LVELAAEEGAVKKPDHAPLVLLRSRVDAAGVPAAGHLPDRFGLTRRPVVRRVEVALAGLLSPGDRAAAFNQALALNS